MASLFRRGSGDDSAAALGLDRGERLLASGQTATGEQVVATDRRLILPAATGMRGIDWDRVERASWDQDEEALHVVEAAPVGSRPRRHRVELERDVRLLDVIREQVTASVVLTRHIPIEGRRGVRVTGRRRPGRDRLSWVAAVDSGLDVSDPKVRARIDVAVDAVRSEVE